MKTTNPNKENRMSKLTESPIKIDIPARERLIFALDVADPDRARQFGGLGRRAAATTFSWERCARDTWAVYEEVLRT